LQTKDFDLSTDVSSSLWSRNAVSTPDADGPPFSLGRLLQMSEGLSFDEDYVPGSLTTEMLFTAPSTSAVMPAPVRRQATSGKKCFHYSSLTSNLLQKYLKSTFGPDGVLSYLSFPTVALFNRLGIRSATLETDPTNTFVGSSFSYMTPRDWAKLGLLWLNDGVWPSSSLTPRLGGGKSGGGHSEKFFEGERILPEGWMNFARTATPTSNGVYGAHFWLGGNARLEESEPHSLECNELFKTRVTPAKEWWRDSFPEGSGTFAAHGFEEQLVAMVPSKGVVVVRMGASKEVVLRWEKEKVRFYRGVMDAIPDRQIS
jgi:CubicO group peptidase (beta-lactamase class C family)